MKTTFLSLAIAFLCTATSFGAIEFSEDQVAAQAADASEVTPARRNGARRVRRATSRSILMAGGGMGGGFSAMQFASVAATNVTGRGGVVRPNAPNNQMFAGGGGGAANGNAASAAPSVLTLASSGAATPGTTTTGPANPASTGTPAGGVGPAAVSMPEPSTAIVWTVLGLCGLAFARRRKA